MQAGLSPGDMERGFALLRRCVLCRTPEELFDLLLEDCLGFEEIQLTGGRRDPNRGDEAALEQLRQSYLAQYRKGEPK